MRFEHAVKVDAPRDVAWAFLMDIPGVAACVPGAEPVTPEAPDVYRGAVRVNVGPIRLRFEGDLTLTHRDDASFTATMRLDAVDRAAGGGLRAEVQMSLAETAEALELRLVTEATLAGRVGELGRPIIKRQVDKIANDFAACLGRSLGATA